MGMPILHINDIKTGETTGLKAVVGSGLVAQPVEPAAEWPKLTPAAPSGPAVPPVEVEGRTI